MKVSNVIFFVMFMLSISACLREDQTGNLEGPWTFGSAFVDGVGTTASGVIDFTSASEGNADIKYQVGSDTLTLNGEFAYVETLSNLSLRFDSEVINMSRSVNTKDEQEFEFEVEISGQSRSIVFDLIPE